MRLRGVSEVVLGASYLPQEMYRRGLLSSVVVFEEPRSTYIRLLLEAGYMLN